MSATKEWALALEEAEMASDLAGYQLTTELATLSNLIWRGVPGAGQDLPRPLATVELAWIEAMEQQLEEARIALVELRTAHEATARQDYLDGLAAVGKAPGWRYVLA
jgi:hypothetical protein